MKQYTNKIMKQESWDDTIHIKVDDLKKYF